LDKFHYPHLHKLTVNYSRDTEDKEREIFLEFTDMFPCLTEVVLISVKVDAASWSLISLHQHITKLSLYYMEIKAADSQAFWEACLKLESLSLDNVTIEDGWIPTNSTSTDSSVSRAEGIALEQYFPGGGTFRFDGGHYHDQLLAPPQSVNPQLWPPEQGIDIHTGSCRESRHFEVDQVSVDGAVVPSPQSALLYVVLSGGDVLAWDIVNGGPWTCQRLRTLDICIRVGEWERDFQPEIFRRLSTLTRLEFLTMTIPEDNIDGLGVLEFQLVHGLGYLANLRKLKYVNFISDVDEDEEDEHGEGDNNGYCPQLGKDEIAWIQLNWKSVSIHGTLNSNTELNLKLRNLLNMFAF
ncbi:hypothetical protein BGX31_003385, partial [Mortierella sp. GBA43]